MAIPLTQEQLDEMEMSKSVMDEPRSGFRKLADFFFGRTLPEQMTQAFATPLGSTQIAKVAPQIADPTTINRALRAMGREALNYMRKTGQGVDVVPASEGIQGSMLAGTRKHVMRLGANAPEATAYHELTGHMFEDILPPQTKAILQKKMGEIPGLSTKIRLRMKRYAPHEIPGEAFAYGMEPPSTKGAGLVPAGERAKSVAASRQTRKDLKEIMRAAFEGESEQATAPSLARGQAMPDDKLRDFLRILGPAVDPNAEVFVKNAELLKKAKGQ